MTEIFRIEELRFRYAGSDKDAISDVSLSLKKKVNTAFIGANGAGKSTLFYHLNGILRPNGGRILYKGNPLPKRGRALRTLRTEVGIVLQNPENQIFCPKVRDDVSFGPRNLGLPEDEVETRVEEAMYFAGISSIGERNVMHLSYGQKRRVAMAGAVAMRPEVLIMDEPTAGLDPRMSWELLETIEEMRSRGMTVVLSTHNMDLVHSWADKVHVLRNGRIVHSGTSDSFYSNTSKVYLSGLVEPAIFSINRGLHDRGMIPLSPYPRNVVQLIAKFGNGRNPGRVEILKATDDIDLEQNGICTGTYGTEARRSAETLGIRTDFPFGADEGCLLEVLRGRDVRIICGEGLTKVMADKIESLSLFGVHIPYTISE